MIYWIPTSTRLSDYTQTVRLGGADYRIRLAWAERERRWFFDLWTGDGTPLVAGKKVVADRCLNRLVTSALGPPGGIWCFDTTDEGSDPDLRDLGTRCLLFYVDDEDGSGG